jgi:hypothetical protein
MASHCRPFSPEKLLDAWLLLHEVQALASVLAPSGLVLSSVLVLSSLLVGLKRPKSIRKRLDSLPRSQLRLQ